jgi:hypothetical protein
MVRSPSRIVKDSAAKASDRKGRSAGGVEPSAMSLKLWGAAPSDTVVPLPEGAKMSMLTHPVNAPAGGNVAWSFRVVF